MIPVPDAPDWQIDWTTIDQYPWIAAMKGCPQNPDRHAEGDVWNHVHLVCEEMVKLPAWRELPVNERRILFTAALLHDVSKPECTRVEADGRISSRGHSWRGAIRARGILWQNGFPFADRELVCGIVRYHLKPLFEIELDDPRRAVIEISQITRNDWLTIMAESDARGRICADRQPILDNIAMFRELADESKCLNAPFSFESDHSRYLYFRDQRRQPDSPAFEESRCSVTVMSGLPASGKDHWLEQHSGGKPIVSLDAIREEMGISPKEAQGAVINEAREQARDHLRNYRDFIWNATNLSKTVRSEVLKLLHDYHARIRIVYVESSPGNLYSQNRNRTRRIPERVIDKLLEKWEVPDLTECHELHRVIA